MPEGRDDPDERHAERPRAVRILDAEHEHANADERRRRAYRCSSGRRSRPHRRSATRPPRQRRCRIVVMYGIRVFGSTAPPTAEAVRRAPSRRRCAAGRTERRAAPPPSRRRRRTRRPSRRSGSPATFERVRERIGRLPRSLVRHHAGEDDADEDVDDRADRETAEDADRQVALRILRLFGRGRNRVEADVREEDDRRALVDAA